MAAQEDVVRRLLELHEAVDDEDRPRAALLAGLAIADLVGLLPGDDQRRGALAAEGLARLAESTEPSPALAAAGEILRAHLTQAGDGKPAAEDQSPGPASFSLSGADLNWDVDWEALHGPSEAARNVVAMLPTMAAMLPPQTPLRLSAHHYRRGDRSI